MGQTLLASDVLIEGELPIYSATEGEHVFGYMPKNNAITILQKGDLIVPARGISIGFVKLVKQPCTSTQTTIQCQKIENSLLDASYSYYFSLGQRKELFKFVRTAIPQITVNEVKNNIILLPPLEEQRKIVQFLDDKCEKIDRFIANKQRMAALLREQKQAVISAAVTGKLNVCDVSDFCGSCVKNLNANDANGARDARAFKASGVAWLGDIPRHWEVRRLKTLFSIINGATPDSGNANYWDGDISWITPVDLHLVDGGIITNGRRNISELGYKNCGTTLLPSGSLVLSTRAPIGYVAITNNVLCTNQGCRGLIPKEQLNVEYFCFQLLALRPILQAFGNGSTFKELSTIPLGNLSVVKPSFQEQQEIVLYLKNTLHQIDRILARIEREIALMQEYRVRLIADVVTGQIDVREKL